MRKAVCVLFVSATFLLLNFSFTMAYEKDIGSLSSAITDNIAKSGKKTVAVVDFTDLQGNITELGRFISEELSVDLSVAARGFEVIDRNHLKSILAEHKLSILELVDPNNVKQLGKIAGVDAIVTGSVTPFVDSVRVTCKVIAADTTKVIGAAKSDIAKTKAIEELLARSNETDANSVLKADTSSLAPKSPLKAEQRTEVKNFIIELQGCNLSGSSITCSLLVTNKGIDRLFGTEVGFSDNIVRVVDREGNEYDATQVRIGNKRDTSLLVSGIPTRAKITFEGVPREVRDIVLLEFTGETEGELFKFQFRDIPLSR